MRHRVYRLAIEVGGSLKLTPTRRRALRRTVIVPRDICVFEQVACQGVAWHERRGFAQLQMLQLAPFLSTGASAAVRHGRLMLWMWDQAEVDAALTAAGMSSRSVRMIAETLLLQVPRASGPHLLYSEGGIDHLVLDHGAIVSSSFQPSTALGKGEASLASRPWARDLLQPSWSPSTVSPRTMALAGAWAIAGLSTVYLAYWTGTYLGLQQQIDARQREPGVDTDRLAAIARLRADERADAAWMQNYRRLTASLQVEKLLDALRSTLEANGLVIKEFEARDDDLRLTLASVGNEIDLPRVLVALQRTPGMEAVQLRQNADTLQATFSMRPAGFRRARVPAGGVP